MGFEIAANVSDIAPGGMKAFEKDGQKILIANIDGAFYAIQQKCSHFGADLCKGTLKSGVVRCPKHGAQFDVRSGDAVGKANMFIFKMQPKNLRTYQTKVSGDKVLVNV